MGRSMEIIGLVGFPEKLINFRDAVNHKKAFNCEFDTFFARNDVFGAASHKGLVRAEDPGLITRTRRAGSFPACRPTRDSR